MLKGLETHTQRFQDLKTMTAMNFLKFDASHRFPMTNVLKIHQSSPKTKLNLHHKTNAAKYYYSNFI